MESADDKNSEHLQQIINELKNLLVEGHDGSKKMSESVSAFLYSRFTELKKHYEQHAHRMSIVSGIIAPLSLTLLQQDQIYVATYFLLLGFIILIANIVFIEIVPLLNLERQDKPLWDVFTHSTLGGGALLFNEQKIKTSDADELTSLVEMQHDIFKAFTLMEKEIDPKWQLSEIIELFRKMKKRAKIYTYIFATGILSLMLSVIVPVIFC